MPRSFIPSFPSADACRHPFSSRAPSAQNGRESHSQDLEVEKQRLTVRVRSIEFDHLLERELASSLHLPETGDAGFRPEALVIGCSVPSHLVARDGARADETHLALQDVDELR